jgi:hypothetical protein
VPHKPFGHTNPLRHSLEYRRNAPRIQPSANLVLTDKPTKYRPLTNSRVLQPNLERPYRLPREIRYPPLPFRIRLAATNKRLASAIRMEVDVFNVEGYKLATTG